MNAWFASWGVPRLEKQGVVLVLLACTSVSQVCWSAGSSERKVGEGFSTSTGRM